MQLATSSLSHSAPLDVRAVVCLTQFAMHAGFAPGSDSLFAQHVAGWATEWQGVESGLAGVIEDALWKRSFEDFAADKLAEVRHLCNP
nr:hypothetical protein [Dyella sp. ASV24]